MVETREENVHLTVNGVRLSARLFRPIEACGLVLIAQDEPYGSSSARIGQLARLVQQAGFATLACDLRGSDVAEQCVDPGDDPARLSVRLTAWLDVVRNRPGIAGLPLGLAALGPAGGAALLVAIRCPERLRALAIVSGRAEQVLDGLAGVRCPTLLAVGEHDRAVQRQNRVALGRLRCHRRLEVLAGLHHQAHDASSVSRIGISIRRWMRRYLIPPADASGAAMRPTLRLISPDAPGTGTAFARSRVGLEALVAATRACEARPLPPPAEED